MKDDLAWHRRHAIQVVSALPESTDDALLVLELATQLVKAFLAGPEPAKKPGATVVALVSGEGRI